VSGKSDHTIGDPFMLELFRTEAQTHASALNTGLLQLEETPGDPVILEGLMRAAHSVKGAARIVKIDVAVNVAHRMEDVFVAAQESRLTLAADQIDVLLKGADMLAKFGELAGNDDHEALSALDHDVQVLVTQLDAVLTAQPVPSTSEEPVPSTTAAEAAPTPAPPPAETPTPAPPQAETPTPAGGSQAEAPQAEAPQAEAPLTEAPAANGRPAAAGPAEGGEAVRVSAEHLNSLMNLTGESMVRSRWLLSFAATLQDVRQQLAGLKTAVTNLRYEGAAAGGAAAQMIESIDHQMSSCQLTFNSCTDAFGEFTRGFENLSDRLYQEAVASRMRPFADGVGGFPRMVRDLTKKLGKKGRLVIVGKQTRVDRDILEELEAPITHLLRNALDHGIETADVRVAAGKPECATLTLEARHHAGMLSISVRDDGRGIDVAKLRDKVVAENRINSETAAGLSDGELLDFLFLPGFTTAAAVTELSGRGVGLDVVQTMVQAVGGALRVTTELGKGTNVNLVLPITLSVVRALLVEVNGEPYAFRLSQIARCLKVPVDGFRAMEGRRYLEVDGASVAVLDARELLALSGTPANGSEVCIVVIGEGADTYGVAVDRFAGEHELVVRPPDQRLGKIPGVSASAIRDDGSPALILDVEDLMHSMAAELSGGRIGRARKLADAQPLQQIRILVVDDSVTVREVERKLLRNHGYAVDVAVDGMDAWGALAVGQYDLVVTDVDMPRMNGIELIENIRGDARLGSLPVLVVSYKDRPEDRERGLHAGANRYLTKSSFQDESLLRAVIDLVGEAPDARGYRQ